ncbi:Do family serine endopeptidase [Kordiimonas lipolytica]|uniref:Probable periplasmic serine endoprotease DegP-like n=1 Tax=Kordiimonas lipolytica TaxID=1662421 RepID=A0ABV8U8P5_9PROT|nr:Do family serine endopeptidase [Kordiimonas lipolytica]
MSTTLVKAINTRTTADMPGKALKVLLASILILAAAMTSMGPVAARGAPDSFADLVEKLSPAVVNISTVQTIRRRGGRNVPDLPEGVPFGDLWDQFRDRMEEDQEPREARSLGSGFIIDAKGIVITNNHVVEDADEITVTTADGDDFPAKVLGRDALSDIAVLKIEHENGDKFPFVKWGDSDDERIGDWVIAIGNPFGQAGTVTAGIISARNRSINNSNDVEFLQTDASINRGNSGGPLFNMNGEVIGVNTAIFSPTGGNVGIGFAIPSNDASRVTAELQEHGKVRRGWLGVGIQPMTEEFAESLGIKQEEGAIVTRVEPNSPADAAGVREGDIIIKWDGKTVEDSNRLSILVKRTEIGKPVKVEVIRQGEKETLEVTTGELPASMIPGGNEGDQDSDRPERSERELVEGMELAPLNETLRRRYEIADDVEGVAVLRVARRAPAARQGIRPGTVILRVNQQSVTNPAEIVDIIEEAREDGRERVLFLVNYRGTTAHVSLKLMRDQGDDEE